MVINVPKGFLDKLSKSTRKELEKVAAEYEFEADVDTREYVSVIGLWGGLGDTHKSTGLETISGADGQFTIKTITKKHSQTLGKGYATVVGFRFIEADLVTYEVRKTIELETKALELDELKKSIGTIKSAIGDVK